MLPAEQWGAGEDYLWYSTGGAANSTDLARGAGRSRRCKLDYLRGLGRQTIYDRESLNMYAFGPPLPSWPRTVVVRWASIRPSNTRKLVSRSVDIISFCTSMPLCTIAKNRRRRLSYSFRVVKFTQGIRASAQTSIDRPSVTGSTCFV